MNAWTDVITHAALQPWAAMAPALLLAVARWFGFLLWLPALGGAGVSLRMRFALALLLAIVVLPVITAHPADFGQILTSAGGLVQLFMFVAGELVLGSVLGLAVRVLFSALQLAGELIDQQAGLALQHVINPLADAESGPSSAAIVWLGLALFFTAAPISGDLALVEVMLQQFTALPVGSSPEIATNSRLPIVLVQQAASLAFQLAGPVLGALSLISLMSAWLGRAAPRLQVGPLVAPVRIAVSLVLLSAALPGLSGVITDALAAAFESGSVSQ
jgi:flagellar biosynthetic protein FliR